MGSSRWRLRFRRWLRVGSLVVAGGVLVAGMAAGVERGAAARELSGEIGEFERREVGVEVRISEGMRRVDSLRSRERITREAKRLGLRPASDEEITFLRETTDLAGEDGR